jgi:hypothetical protein
MAWDIAGVLSVFFAGSALHFAYEASGNCPWVGAFAPVNESVWEHFKLGFWPGVAFALVEWAAGPRGGGFWAGRAAWLLAVPLIVGAGFYAYTAVLGRHLLAADILLFLGAVAAGRGVGRAVERGLPPGPSSTAGGVALLGAMAILFALATFCPPKWPVFRDSRTGLYGLPRGRG